jgi:hypothetical protein
MADTKISALPSGAPAQAGDEYVIARGGANYKLTLTNIAASMAPIGATTPNTGAFTTLSASGVFTAKNGGSAAAPDITTAGDTNTGIFFPAADTIAFSEGGVEAIRLTSTGNLQFSGTAQRITGDFSNATLSNRLAFQTSTTNGNTIVGAFPNGTGLNARLQAFSTSDPANASTISFEANGGISQSAITADKTGTGSYLPMTFYTGGSERVRIDTSGNVGIGGTAGADTKVAILGTLSSAGTASYGYRSIGTVPSASTGGAISFDSTPSTQAASFTCAALYHFSASQGTIGSGSAVTNQHGFSAQSALTGATNNYGFYSAIVSGSNRWNFYAAGTAANYLAGNLSIGTTATSYKLHVRGVDATSSNFSVYVDNSAATVLSAIRNDGLTYSGTAAASPYNNVSGAAANMYVDASGILYRATSSLRYKSDVTDAAHGLADVLKLRSVTYKAKNSGDTVFGGLIAEEVHDAGLTEFVAYDKEGRPDALHYGNMVALLVKAVQELTARVAELEAK